MDQERRSERQRDPARRAQPPRPARQSPRTEGQPFTDPPAARRRSASPPPEAVPPISRRAERAQAQAEAARRPEPGKRPPKRKGVFSNPLFYLLFVFGLSAILAALSWTAANDVLALNKPYVQDLIIVKEEDSFGNVVDQLKEKGMIEYKSVFRLFSSLTGSAEKVVPGAYWIDTDMDYRAIIGNLSARSGSRDSTSVTIPEGYNIDQIFQLLEQKGVSTAAKLQDMAATHDYAFSFLQEIPLGDYKRLEGYLFPDTYEFYMGEDPRFILNKMLVNFDAKLTDSLRAQIEGSQYSIRDVIIMASMIEKETDGEDRAKISSVIHNRLEKSNREVNGKLEIDATLQYVLPEGQYVTQADYRSLESPYNTYLHQGLPPGPIANPGMESILAAMNPEKTGYFYYALGADSKHHFFKTYAEHQAFLAQ